MRAARLTIEAVSDHDIRPVPCDPRAFCAFVPGDPRRDESLAHDTDEFRLIVGDDFCYGLKEPKEWILEDWLEDQGFIAYDNMNVMFDQITGTEAGWKETVPDTSVIDMFFMTAYNIDKFRKFIFESTFLDHFEVDQATQDRIRVDDQELLKFGFKWLKFGLLGEKTMTLRKDREGKKKK
jgi:hypothetical protein